MGDCKAQETNLVTLRTNYLMVVGGGYGTYYARPYKAEQRSADDPLGAALLPCRMKITQEEYMVLSYQAANLVSGDLMFKKRDYLKNETDKKRILQYMINSNNLDHLHQREEDIFWGDDLKTRFNVLSSTMMSSSIAVLGDFQELSNAFMLAQINGGGFVDVHFDPQSMTSDIRYTVPKLNEKQPSQTLQMG